MFLKKLLLVLIALVFFSVIASAQQVCGNDIREGTEICDDGLTNGTTDLRYPTDKPQVEDGECIIRPSRSGPAGCYTSYICGDGYLWTLGAPQPGGTEECDWRLLNSDTTPNSCRTDCTLPVCGDGVTDNNPPYNEACDDGNLINNDICANDCTLNTVYCGDGTWQPFGTNGIDEGGAGDDEACDDVTAGDLPHPDSTDDGSCIIDWTNGYACKDNTCQDGYLNLGPEECDDGNSINNDACSPTCTINLFYCGNGILEPDGSNTIPEGGAGDDEQCDDGANGILTDGCTDSCKRTTCGDGIVQALNGNFLPEQCDDGNNTPLDGCDALCQIEDTPVCGDGSLQAGGGVWNEQCETAGEWSQALCFSNECDPQTCQCIGTSTGVKVTTSQGTQLDVFKDDIVPDEFIVNTFVLNSQRDPQQFDIEVQIFRGVENAPYAALTTLSNITFAPTDLPDPEFSINIHEITDFDAVFQSLPPGSYRAHVEIKEGGTPNLADSTNVFFTVVPSDVKVEVNETDPLLIFLAALTVIGIVYRQKIKKVLAKQSFFKKKKK